MKRILFIGLLVSVVSILFNVLIYTLFSNRIAEKEKEISFLRARNLVLSNEFNHAEHFEFFSDYYTFEIESRIELDKSKVNSENIKNLFIKRDRALIKTINYAYNSTILNPLTDYDSLEISRIIEYINEFETNRKSKTISKFNRNKVNQLLSLFIKFYKQHEKLIKTNNEKISEIMIALSDLNKFFGISKGVAISLQVVGLILVFLKDYKS